MFIKPTNVSIISFHDLPGSSEMSELGGFNSFAYGDSQAVLMRPMELVGEVERHISHHDNEDGIKALRELREALIDVATQHCATYISFDEGLDEAHEIDSDDQG